MVTWMFCPQCQSGSDDSTTQTPFARTDTDEWNRGEITCFRCLYYTSGTDDPPLNQVFHRMDCPRCEFPMATDYDPEIYDLREKPPTTSDIRRIECCLCLLKIKQDSTGVFISRQPEYQENTILLRRNDMIREAQIFWRNTMQDALNSTYQDFVDWEDRVRTNYLDTGE